MNDDDQFGEPFVHDHGDELPLTKVQLDEVAERAPLCEDCGKHRVPVMIYAGCCEGTAVRVSYSAGLIKVECYACETTIAFIAVDPGKAPETP